jgi:hexosaminidase
MYCKAAYFVSLILSFLAGAVCAQDNVIPVPVSVQKSDAKFVLDGSTDLYVLTSDPQVGEIAQQFAAVLRERGFDLDVSTAQPAGKAITLSLNPSRAAELGDEGYVLTVDQDKVAVAANGPAGLFYALQTLRQLLPAGKVDGAATIPGCTIRDYPRFKWRGLMLDVSRHFFTKEEVKKFIDVMAQYKFNTFHWHLTDDNGWRIEIKSLPKLTEVGAWRVERHGPFGSRPDPKPGEPATYGGFYTHADIREVVQYASERNITIIPEIDVPGHSMAALAAYPELSTRKEPKFVNPGSSFAEWYGDGKFRMLIENTLNPADEKVYDFLEKVFSEVASLFPAPYIHVGGDEAYQGFWLEDPGCQALMKKHKLKDGHELQSYFMKRVAKIIQKQGKKMIGWDEILEGGLAKGAAVMSWRGMEGGIAAAKHGHEVVMSPTTYAYLDYTQGDRSLEIPIYADLSLKKAYEFEPLPEGVDPKFILGGQANLWTEHIPTLRHAFYMTYPRAFATAESVWSPASKKNWENFCTRVLHHFERFDAESLNVCKALYDPIVRTKMENGKLVCEITCDLPGTELHYTLDRTFPDAFTPKYTGAITIPDANVTLKVVSVRDGKVVGRMISLTREELEQRAGK